jgi:hypothetical protein
MALQQKEEQIKTELGDRTGLTICWWNQGALHGKLGDKKKQIMMWQKSIDRNKFIGIPTEKYEKLLTEL